MDINANDFLPYEKALPGLMERFLELNLKNWKIKYEKWRDARSLESSKRVMEWITEVVHRGVQHLEVVNETCIIKHLDLEMETYEIKGNVDFRPRFMSKTMRQIMQGSLKRRRDNEKERSEVDFMPKYMYVSKTLVSLKVVNVGLEDPKFDISLPRLKKMHLENIYYMCGDGILIIQKLISASTVLEDLTMDVPVAKKPKEIVFMEEQTGIKLVNYFLENSAVLKKLTLRLTDPSKENKEFYKSFLTSIKLSPTCQVLVY